MKKQEENSPFMEYLLKRADLERQQEDDEEIKMCKKCQINVAIKGSLYCSNCK